MAELWGYGRVTYSFEHQRRLRVGFVGCGGHSWRNVYPTLQYAPVELVAVADPHQERAAAYARQFGAPRHYPDHREMLAHERLDAIFAVTDYDERGHPRYPQIAVDALHSGAHAWIEKPPAATVEEVQQMLAAERATGRFVQVGLQEDVLPGHRQGQGDHLPRGRVRPAGADLRPLPPGAASRGGAPARRAGHGQLP